MFDPFRSTRAKATRKLRRATVSAVTDVWGAMLAPTKPAKRKGTKKAKPAAKATKPSAVTRKAAGKRGSTRANAKSSAPATSRLKKTVPHGAAFPSGTYESAFGTRSYKLYIPAVAKSAPEPLPLIVMLHGCGQSSVDFARGTGMNTLAEEFGFLVLYPAQARDAHHYRCWNWYRQDDQARGAGEPALIAGLARHIIAVQNVDPAKVYVAGLSAGAAAALIVATAYPDVFAAVGIHSGLAVGAAHDSASAPMAMQSGNPGRRHEVQMPTIIFHGDSDKVVNPRNSRFIAIRALEPYAHLDRAVKTGRVSGGREFTRTVHRVGKGRPCTEQWVVHGAGHAWSGGHAAGSYTDPKGPDASRQMVRFFLRHRTTKKCRATQPV
ncbi:PHB depolymerase family esterase [uncultured Marivita sp.]|uniref:extracellular catalytic domain type 1 short-chain-length polyhydroxyalkanoate depolymerase n=1 Tax=uncultured Marivita sp. TaxID=888080 RepID=UPI00261EBA7C|nr:PHB depolymerase family esterase [uncultured Marivita sp.]